MEQRAKRSEPEGWRESGWLRLAVGALLIGGGGCSALAPQAAGPLPELAPYQGREIQSVDFLAPQPFSQDTLLSLIETRPTRCRLLGVPICVPLLHWGRQVHTLDTDVLASDVVRLAVFYRRNGYFGTRVRPGVQPKGGGKVAVTFAILRGDAVTLDSLTVEGTEGIVDPDSLARELPLKPGQPFDLGLFGASADTIQSRLHALGYAYSQVLRNYGVDTIQDRATAQLLAIPGPQVRVDSIRVVGAPHLGRGATLQQLELHEGDLLRATDLVASQRNLYALDIVQFATVDVAPDSLQVVPEDSSRTTVLVRIAEAPVHVVDASMGYGTIECFRARSSWTSRSVGGGGRKLTVVGQVSKLGLGDLTYSRQLESSLCRSLEGGRFERQLDYHLSTDFTQPYFFSAHNQLTTSLFLDRTSEPNLFQRTSRGGRFTVARRFQTQDIISGTVELVNGRTDANQAIFCIALLVCEPERVGQLTEFRWRNALSGSFARDRTDQALDPTRGYRLRSVLDWATPLIGSDLDFVRWTGEASTYSTVSRGVVAGAYVRLGTFFNTANVIGTENVSNFLPPEERFFAGGANSVRGYGRNELGPLVYVASALTDTMPDGTRFLVPDSAGNPVPAGTPQAVPIGGTSVAVASAEVRFPSPVLPEYLRLAAFLDVGSVDTTTVWHLSRFRFTPGFGFRISTPVGPARLDLGYNPYPPRPGPLLVTDQISGDVFRIDDNYKPEWGTFLSRFRIQLAVGQAF